MTDETLEQEPTLKDVIKSLAEIHKRLDTQDTQLEVIREGISYNASRFDRLDSKVYRIQSEISDLKADIRDLTEEVRQNQKTLSLK